MTIIPNRLRTLAVAALLAASFPLASVAQDAAPCVRAQSEASLPVKLRAEAPLLGRIVEDFAGRDLGEAFSVEGLADRTREIALMAASAVLGDAASTEQHAKAALAAGATQAEVKEVLYLTVARAGVEKAIAATRALSGLLADSEKHGS
jgi:alkylhydroperoxidase/carboxymuconolactone decarboxylase family protein YurZ